MALYNLKTLSSYYQITKFDDDMNVENSYETNEEKCNCPAGERGRYCRHKKMVEIFISHGRVNGDWFFDFDRSKWVKPWTEEEEALRRFRRRV